jgi:predicted nucleotidyltransferase
MGTVYRTLEYLERLRPAPGDRQKALADARAIADHLKREYGAEVYGVGSLFVAGRNFTERSDIDLVVKGLPVGRFFSILVKLDDMSSFKLDLIPFEDANEYMRKQALEEGERL